MGYLSLVADSATPSVIAGLAIGIALVVLFAVIFPQRQPQDESSAFQSYRLTVEDRTFTIPYRFSEGADAKIVDFTVNLNTFSIQLTVEVPYDNTLEIHLPVEMLKQMESPNEYGYHVGEELVVFVDETPDDTMWQYGEQEEIATIKLESGSETIEIVGTYPL